MTLLSIIWLSWTVSLVLAQQCNKELGQSKLGELVVRKETNRKHWMTFQKVKEECPVSFVEKFRTTSMSINNDKSSVAKLFDGYFLELYPTLKEEIAEAKLLMQQGIVNKAADFLEIKFVKKTGIYLDFIFIYWETSSDRKEIFIKQFNGQLNRKENSPDCHPTDDVGTWNDETIYGARNYYIVKELEHISYMKPLMECARTNYLLNPPKQDL